jgi:hypothetical protein
MCRLRCRNFSAVRETPGNFGSAANAFAFSGSSVHFFDQSERTITTDLGGWLKRRRLSRSQESSFGTTFKALTLRLPEALP